MTDAKQASSKHASSKHKRKERRSAERTMARDGADRLAEAARKREASEADRLDMYSAEARQLADWHTVRWQRFDLAHEKSP
jgi:hypothetical protein